MLSIIIILLFLLLPVLIIRACMKSLSGDMAKWSANLKVKAFEVNRRRTIKYLNDMAFAGINNTSAIDPAVAAACRRLVEIDKSAKTGSRP